MSVLPHPSARRRAPLHCLSLEGSGTPDSPQFQSAVWALYSVAYMLRLALEHAGRPAFEVPPLAGIWSARRKARKWKLVLPVPDSLTQCIVEAAKFGASQKRRNPSIPSVTLVHLQALEVLQLIEVEAAAADTDCAVEEWAERALARAAK